MPLLVAVLGCRCSGSRSTSAPVALGALLAVAGFGFGYGMGMQRPFRDAVPVDVRGQAFGLHVDRSDDAAGRRAAAVRLAAEVVPVGLAMAARWGGHAGHGRLDRAGRAARSGMIAKSENAGSQSMTITG